MALPRLDSGELVKGASASTPSAAIPPWERYNTISHDMDMSYHPDLARPAFLLMHSLKHNKRLKEAKSMQSYLREMLRKHKGAS